MPSATGHSRAFLRQCATLEDFPQACLAALRSGDRSVQESVTVVLQKLSEDSRLAHVFSVSNLKSSLLEMAFAVTPDTDFIVMNIKSILSNLRAGLAKKEAMRL